MLLRVADADGVQIIGDCEDVDCRRAYRSAAPCCACREELRCCRACSEGLGALTGVEAGNADVVEDVGNADVVEGTGNADVVEEAGNADVVDEAGNADVVEEAENADVDADGGRADVVADVGNEDVVADAEKAEGGKADVLATAATDAGKADVVLEAGKVDVLAAVDIGGRADVVAWDGNADAGKADVDADVGKADVDVVVELDVDAVAELGSADVDSVDVELEAVGVAGSLKNSGFATAARDGCGATNGDAADTKGVASDEVSGCEDDGGVGRIAFWPAGEVDLLVLVLAAGVWFGAVTRSRMHMVSTLR